MILYVEDARRAVRPLEQFADPDEVPTFAMGHGGIGDPLK